MEVVVREVLPQDLPVFFEFQRDEGSALMAAVASRDRDAFDTHWQRILADDETTIRTIVCDGAVAGNVLAFPRDGVVEVGYWIGREFWGRGLATKGLEELLRIVTTRPLHAAVARGNEGSMRVLEKCGFEVTQHRVEPNPVTGEEIEFAFFELR
jgi:RimJ/RimL family protein N-acetyltransferase